LWSENAVALVRKLWTEAWFGGNCDNYEHEPEEKKDRLAGLEYIQYLLAKELKTTDDKMVLQGHKFAGFAFETLTTSVEPEFQRFFETEYARYRRSGEDAKLQTIIVNMERILQYLHTQIPQSLFDPHSTQRAEKPYTRRDTIAHHCTYTGSLDTITSPNS
jgi:hypothetical protein